MALMPDEYVEMDGKVHRPNPVQQIVNREWGGFVKWAKKIVGKDPYACVFNGDSIEGVHHGGHQLVVKDTAAHAAMFVECVTPLVEPEQCKKVFMVQGTECHTNATEHYIGLELGAVSSGRSYCFPELHIDVRGFHVAFWHHMPTSSRFHLAASQLSIQYSNAVANYSAWGYPAPRLVCAGHRHVHGFWSYGNGGMVVTGAWQIRTRFAHKVAPGCIEAFSGVVLDWRGLPDGSMPVVHEYVRPFSPPTPVSI